MGEEGQPTVDLTQAEYADKLAGMRRMLGEAKTICRAAKGEEDEVRRALRIAGAAVYLHAVLEDVVDLLEELPQHEWAQDRDQSIRIYTS